MSTRLCHRILAVAFAGLIFFSIPSLADPNATITGLITDPTGRAVVGVTVALTNVNTNIPYKTTTNGQGIYRLTGLLPGIYRANVIKDGFKSIVKGDIELHVQDEVSLNFALQVGSVTESVTVEGGAPIVHTESPAVSTIVDHQFVKELPLNGRSFQTLFQLTPGVVITSTASGDLGQFSVNGQRADANYFMLDGVSANVGIATGFGPGQSAAGAIPAFTAGGGTNSLVSADAMQEFAIQTSGYAPEYGRTPGAQIAITTRSGTNRFHGDLYEYLRNEIFDANDWFANHNGLKRAPLKQNDFGGVFGGPIFKDRTFFFLSLEGLRLHQPRTGITDVPTVASRNAAPAAIRPYLEAFPLPTGADEGNGLAPGNYTFSDPSLLDAASIRLDHHLKQNVSLFARYDYSDSWFKQRGAQVGALSSLESVPVKLQTGTAGITWLARPTISNDFRVNWSWSYGSVYTTNDRFGGAVPLTLASAIPSDQDPNNSLFTYQIFSGNVTQVFLGKSAANLQRQLNIVDTVSWQLRSHLVKAGVDYRRLTPEESPTAYLLEADFNTVDDAINGIPADSFLKHGTTVDITYDNYSAFVQDTWHATQRANIAYGVRWDYSPAPVGTNKLGLPQLSIVSNGDPSNLAVAPVGTPLYHASQNNFAPRLGIVYKVRDAKNYETIVTSGFGVFYDLGNGPSGDVYGGTPFSAAAVNSPASFPFSPSDAAAPPLTSAPPFSLLFAFPKNLRQPYTYHWNLSLDQALGPNQSITLGYIAAAGHSLLRQTFVSGASLPSDFASVRFVDNSGYSNYNALQAQFRRRQSAGLEILGSYTWAHSLDNASTDTAGSASSLNVLQSSPTLSYGSSDFDIRHTGSLAIDYEPTHRWSSGWANAFLRGWGLNTFLIARSAPTINITYIRRDGNAFITLRPDIVDGTPTVLNDTDAAGGVRINSAAFAIPASVRQGDLRRNTFRGFGLFQNDISVRRTFRIREAVRLEARIEAFNVVNHPNFAPERSSLGAVVNGITLFPSGGFGLSQSTFATGVSSAGSGAGFNPLYQIGGPRSLQLALRLQF